MQAVFDCVWPPFNMPLLHFIQPFVAGSVAQWIARRTSSGTLETFGGCGFESHQSRQYLFYNKHCMFGQQMAGSVKLIACFCVVALEGVACTP